MKIGILALQGAFEEHSQSLNRLGIDNVEIRNAFQLDDIDGLILPGGNYRNLARVMYDLDLVGPIKDHVKRGLPVWGTCAGMVVMATTITQEDVPHISLMDINVCPLSKDFQGEKIMGEAFVPEISEQPIPLYFRRAPIIESAGASVEIIHTYDEKIVAAREKDMLVTSFHPELTEDLSWHKYFIHMINESKGA